ncbi:MAG: TetM/TetW/TetO/TetS family tetracycline resistance ribosomal protection protein [Lachnospiraceae bacterium]|nr:TetM/TetW/TetO/TetS family tetracycline resistance ribosomal protection protein [Lachnospiraceae bacterium]
MKRITLGVLAHVDAGKTTLSEALLYESGMIKSVGRVDSKDAFLDVDEQERARGITIFSKQAIINYGEMKLTLLDTPGHVDFSAEMERALSAMDYAVLVISGSDGVQGHTITLWRLLKRYNIPTFIFVNKMDLERRTRSELLLDMTKNLGGDFVDFSREVDDDFFEQIATCDEELLDHYLGGDEIDDVDIAKLVKARSLYPVYFGSALKIEGVKALLEGIERYSLSFGDETAPFGARVYKVTRDAKGERLTFIKLTAGSLKAKALVGDDGEKINQIRMYSGEKYESADTAYAGEVCAVTGITSLKSGDVLGNEHESLPPSLEPVLTYTIILPDEVSPIVMLDNLKNLGEEIPELNITWQEETKTIQAMIMGEVQTEILKNIVADRFGVDIRFGEGAILYKETIADTVYGIGHFEPLRHYAEVHLKLEPAERGSGLHFLADCSEDILAKNWQRLILTHLEERKHTGVLTNSPITDMTITVVAGRSHTKHTEGGDFRKATYRAVRHGLMQAESVLLEPYYEFRLDIPSDCIGRAMTDVEAMFGKCEPPVIEGEKAVLTGTAPVSTMRDYQIQVNSYTKGMGSIAFTVSGYDICHNPKEVIERIGYDPDSDTRNPSSSVFCSHGAGDIVPWYEVNERKHVDCFYLDGYVAPETVMKPINGRGSVDLSIDLEQIDAIISRTSHANEKAGKHAYKKTRPELYQSYKGKERNNNGEKYLIVDGYNIVHAWDNLKELSETNLEAARNELMDVLTDYQGFTGVEVILVFDAYKVKGSLGEFFDYHNIHVVYTKEAQTADAYIEQLTHKISKEYQVTVATSDGLIQLITRGQNCMVMSARGLKEEIERVRAGGLRNI